MVPNLSNVLNGWTEKKQCLLIVVDIGPTGKKIELARSVTMDINVQPTPSEELKKMPMEYWSWDWWSCIIRNPQFDLKTNDAIIVDGARYRVQSKTDWRRSGFAKFSCIRDYDFSIETTEGKIVKYNGEFVQFEGSYLSHE
jgi:hypothetical protein